MLCGCLFFVVCCCRWCVLSSSCLSLLLSFGLSVSSVCCLPSFRVEGRGGSSSPRFPGRLPRLNASPFNPACWGIWAGVQRLRHLIGLCPGICRRGCLVGCPGPGGQGWAPPRGPGGSIPPALHRIVLFCLRDCLVVAGWPPALWVVEGWPSASCRWRECSRVDRVAPRHGCARSPAVPSSAGLGMCSALGALGRTTPFSYLRVVEGGAAAYFAPLARVFGRAGAPHCLGRYAW